MPQNSYKIQKYINVLGGGGEGGGGVKMSYVIQYHDFPKFYLS